ncbi:MAG: UDP-N-acetylmuramate--alanine ligase, partial [Burkholderiaceae bacterium]|nr:UDP-N-acetylmuramate--alanine ligase [Burkholderiaceae bacterium]
MSRAYNSHSNAGDTAVEIAAAAARLIAEEGCDYALAKRKAVRAVLGEGEGARAQLPDNALIEAELRRYLQTFAADSQPAQLTALRSLALDWMSRLAEFNPHLVGAVLNGTATEHSDVHLHLFTDSVKDVEIALLNAGIAFEVEAGADEPGGPEEVLQFVVR